MNETGLRLQSVLTRIQMSIIKSLPDILAGLLLLALFALVAWILRHILRQAFNRAKIDKDVAGMVVRIAFFGVLTIGVF